MNECRSTRPRVKSALVMSAWSHIKPTFSMHAGMCLINMIKKKSLFNKSWRTKHIYAPLIPFSIPHQGHSISVDIEFPGEGVGGLTALIILFF